MRSTVFFVIVSLVLLLPLKTFAAQPAVDLSALGAQPLHAHPRLILTDDRLKDLKALEQTDPVYKTAVDEFLKRAQLYLAKPPVQDSTDWNVWRDAISRIYVFSFAWRLTGEDQYGQKSKETLLAVCGYKDWHDNPGFLDTAEMTHAVAIGYDWMYNYLDKDSRATLKIAIITKGLQPGLQNYAGKAPNSWWTGSPNNWNLVCNSGLLLGALAIYDEDPAEAPQVVVAAVNSMKHGLVTYDPDGAWMEGENYWEYATRYAVLALAAHNTAMGTDFGLSKSKGLPVTWKYAKYVTSPNDLTIFSYSDTLEHHWSLPFLFWLSTKYDVPEAAEYELTYFGKPHPWWPTPDKEVTDPRHAINRVLELVWYVPSKLVLLTNIVKPPDLDARFTGRVEIASFRSAWHDPNALCIFAKAGENGGLTSGHGHLDEGSFELYALGIRWAKDPGREDYGPGYFDLGTPGNPGKRWAYFGASTAGHSTLTLDSQNQDPFGTATITQFGSSPTYSFVTMDLTHVYHDQAAKVTRGIAELEHRAVLVQDELVLDQPREVVWGMNTEAVLDCQGATATVTRWGKKLTAQILSPAGAEFVSENIPKNMRRLAVHLKDQKGPVRLVILLSPDWGDGKTVRLPDIKPLAEWKLPETTPGGAGGE